MVSFGSIADVSKYKNQIASLNAKISAIQAENQKLKGVNNSLSNQIKQLKNELNKINNINNQLQTDNNYLKQQSQQFNQNYAQLKTNYQNLQNSEKALQSNNQKLQNLVGDLQGKVKSLEVEKANSNQTLQEIKNQSSTFQTTVKNLEKQNTTLQKEVISLKTKQTQSESIIAELQTTNQQLQERNSALVGIIPQEQNQLATYILQVEQSHRTMQKIVDEITPLAIDADRAATKAEQSDPTSIAAIAARNAAQQAQVVQAEANKALDIINKAEEEVLKIADEVTTKNINLQTEAGKSKKTQLDQKLKEAQDALGNGELLRTQAETAYQEVLKYEETATKAYDNWGTVSNVFGFDLVTGEITEVTLDETNVTDFTDTDNWQLIEATFGII